MSNAEDQRELEIASDHIRWRVRDVAKQRGIPTAHQLGQHTRINKNSANSLWNGSSLRIDLETLGRLCAGLNCTPGELLVYEGTQQNEG